MGKGLGEALPLPVQAPPATAPRSLPPCEDDADVESKDWAAGLRWQDLFEGGTLEKHLHQFLRKSDADYKHGAIAEGGPGPATDEVRATDTGRCTDQAARSMSAGSMHRARQETGKKSGEARIPWKGFVEKARDIMMRDFCLPRAGERSG